MKVIAFNGSPHTDGAVAKSLSIMKDELQSAGINIETLQVGGKLIHGCVACGKCKTNKRCAIDGDFVNPALDKLKDADGLILGSPTYYGSIAGTFKSFLDRLFFVGTGMQYKVGASVVSLRRSGGISTFHQLNNYFTLAQMVITPSMYWDVIHGNNFGEIAKDEEGTQIMQVQGRNMAWLLKSLAAAKKDVPLPVLPERKWTNFIR